MYFRSLRSFAFYLANQAVRQHKENIKNVLTLVGRATAKQARSMVGTLQPGIGPYPAWERLANATVERKTRYGLGKGGDPETPLYATGRFARAIRFKVDANRGCVHVGTNVEYIMYTELGTAHMPPRPVFSPAALRTVPKFIPTLAESVAASLIGANAFYQFTSPHGQGDGGSLIE